MVTSVPASPSAQSEYLTERIIESAIHTMDMFSIYLGDRLGFYRALASAESLSPAELAEQTSCDQRYVREWLEQQAVTGILQVQTANGTGDSRRYTLVPGYADVLTNTESLAYLAPLAAQLAGLVKPLDEIVAAYRTGGGVPFEHYGTDMVRGIADANRVLFINQLATEWIPAMPDIDRRLNAEPPARVADFGCGSGWSSIALARGYPKVRVDGLDLDQASIDLARTNARNEGLDDRISFHLRDANDPELHGQYDLAMAFECIHDMADPVGALRAMRQLVGQSGPVLIGDEMVAESFTAPGDEIERLMYGFSILHCLPVGRTETPSAETGTIMRPETLRRYASDAGFSAVDILPIEHDLWRFYRLTP